MKRTLCIALIIVLVAISAVSAQRSRARPCVGNSKNCKNGARVTPPPPKASKPKAPPVPPRRGSGGPTGSACERAYGPGYCLYSDGRCYTCQAPVPNQFRPAYNPNQNQNRPASNDNTNQNQQPSSSTANPSSDHARRARALVIPGGSGNAQDVDAVARLAAILPDYVISQFERQRIRIVACRGSVTDAFPKMRGVTPRGWPAGSTWDTVPGFYLSGEKRVVVATVASSTGARIVPPPTPGSGSHGSVNLVAHESIHGYDYGTRHVFINDRAFIEARNADLGCLQGYERQNGQAGLEESFAESGAKFLTVPNEYRVNCPNLFRYWQSRTAATLPGRRRN